jgi:hypothetical protein
MGAANHNPPARKRYPAACRKMGIMKTLEIQVPDGFAAEIERVARERGISVDQLLQASVEEKIQRDAEFDAVAARVLEKNAELYRRLA